MARLDFLIYFHYIAGVFFINDEEYCSLKPKKGIRQGDPISPYFFLLVADVLSRSLLNAIQEGSLMRLKMTHHCPKISHILFADDSLFILHANELVAIALFDILEEYRQPSGQRINFNKSSIIFTPNTSNLRKKVNIWVFLQFLARLNQRC